MRIENRIEEYYESTTEREASVLLRLQRQVEMWGISTLYAPLKHRNIKEIKEKHKQTVRGIGDEAKDSIATLTETLSDSFKGAYARKVNETMEDKAQEYDDL